MADRDHLSIVKRGPEIWNEWRRKNHKVNPDLSGADLSAQNLRSVNFSHVNLQRANMRGTDLSWASLGFTQLHGANLVKAGLGYANLHSAMLLHADLTEADLSFARAGANFMNANLSLSRLFATDLWGAQLSGVDFTDATIGQTRFGPVDFRKLKGLETVKHSAPSTIPIVSIYMSMGQVPEVFLRGTGVPESFIANMKSLVAAMSPVDFYSCFISYSNKDEQFASRVYADLQASGVRCWFFPENAKWGEPVWGEIDRSIKLYDKLIVICSTDSLQSAPVNREIERALQREDREHRNVLFPVRIDDYLFEKWDHPRKADVTVKVVGDFRSWTNPSSYDAAFRRLLANLKSDGAERATTA